MKKGRNIATPAKGSGFRWPCAEQSQRAELNRRPADYESQINVFRKVLISGWFYFSTLFTDIIRHSINSMNFMNSACLENFNQEYVIVNICALSFFINNIARQIIFQHLKYTLWQFSIVITNFALLRFLFKPPNLYLSKFLQNFSCYKLHLVYPRNNE